MQHDLLGAKLNGSRDSEAEGSHSLPLSSVAAGSLSASDLSLFPRGFLAEPARFGFNVPVSVLEPTVMNMVLAGASTTTLIQGLSSASYQTAAGGVGGYGEYEAGGAGGAANQAGSPTPRGNGTGGAAGTPPGGNGGNGSTGGVGAGGTGGGGGADTLYTSSQIPTTYNGGGGGAGGDGYNGYTESAGGGGGGGGGAGAVVLNGNINITNASLYGGPGGHGGNGGFTGVTNDPQTAGGGAGGDGGSGLVLDASGISFTNQYGSIGGVGGAGGNGSAALAGGIAPAGNGGNGGNGGAGIFAGDSNDIVNNAGAPITGGKGGAGGTGTIAGPGGLGGPGIVGSNLQVTNAGTISGGATFGGGHGDAIDFTGGNNFLMLASAGTAGQLVGDVSITGTLNIDPVLNQLPYAMNIKDGTGGPGTLNKIGNDELILSGTLTYTGGTSVSAGILDVASPMNDNGTITVASGAAFILDTLFQGGASNVTVTSNAGSVELLGAKGADIFAVPIAVLTTDFTASGGGGAAIDQFSLTTAGTVTASALAGLSHFEQLGLANGSNTLTLPDALVSSADDNHLLTVMGGPGIDVIDAHQVTSSGNRVALFGLGGADRFEFTAAGLLAADTVNGGNDASLDQLRFMTAGVIAAGQLGGVTHIEQVALANGTNSIAIPDTLVTSADDNHVLALYGGTGNDTIDGSGVTTGANSLHVYAGTGNDALTGGAGADIFYFAANALDGSDHVNGGTGSAIDAIDFVTAGTIAAAAFAGVTHIEKVVLANGTNSLAIPDPLVSSADDNHVLTIYGGTGNDTIDGSLVTTAANSLRFNAGTGNDTLTGGAGADTFYFAVAALDGSDKVNGGTGAAIDLLDVTTAGTVTAPALAQVTHVEKIAFSAGSHAIAIPNALVASADDNHTLTVVGNSGADIFDASGVTTATNTVRFEGLAGGDLFVSGAGADRFIYLGVSDSTGNANGTAYDTLQNFNITGGDRIDLPNSDRPAVMDQPVLVGTLSRGTGTFDTDMHAAIDASLGGHTAVLFQASLGNLSGHEFLVVNPTGTDGYSPGVDYVFDVTGYTGSIATSTFI